MMNIADIRTDYLLKTFDEKDLNQNAFVQFEIWFDELINTKDEFVTEAGDIEKWDGSGKAQLLKYKEEALEYLKKQKK